MAALAGNRTRSFHLHSATVCPLGCPTYTAAACILCRPRLLSVRGTVYVRPTVITVPTGAKYTKAFAAAFRDLSSLIFIIFFCRTFRKALLHVPCIHTHEKAQLQRLRAGRLQRRCVLHSSYYVHWIFVARRSTVVVGEQPVVFFSRK